MNSVTPSFHSSSLKFPSSVQSHFSLLSKTGSYSLGLYYIQPPEANESFYKVFPLFLPLLLSNILVFYSSQEPLSSRNLDKKW